MKDQENNNINDSENHNENEQMPVDEHENVDTVEQDHEVVEHLGDEEEEDAEKKRNNKRGNRGGSGSKNNQQNTNTNNEETEKMTAELSEMKDKYLRLYAEFDNYRKRTAKEKLDLIKSASQEVMKALLPTIDDFERAIKMADMAGSNESVPEGIRLIYEKMANTLVQSGLKEMESTGQPFNPDLHEALTKIPAPTPELKGKVVDTLEKGYYLGDKIIRYAKVVIGE